MRLESSEVAGRTARLRPFAGVAAACAPCVRVCATGKAIQDMLSSLTGIFFLGKGSWLGWLVALGVCGNGRTRTCFFFSHKIACFIVACKQRKHSLC